MRRSGSELAPLAGGECIVPATRVDCVLLSCFDQDAGFWATMLSESGIRLHRADSLEKADFLLLATGATVLLSDLSFLDGSWEHAAAMVQNVHPHVATIVCAETSDNDAPRRAQEHGALNVLSKPLDLWRIRSSILLAHEIALERRLWYAAATARRETIAVLPAR